MTDYKPLTTEEIEKFIDKNVTDNVNYFETPDSTEEKEYHEIAEYWISWGGPLCSQLLAQQEEIARLKTMCFDLEKWADECIDDDEEGREILAQVAMLRGDK